MKNQLEIFRLNKCQNLNLSIEKTEQKFVIVVNNYDEHHKKLCSYLEAEYGVKSLNLFKGLGISIFMIEPTGSGKTPISSYISLHKVDKNQTAIVFCDKLKTIMDHEITQFNIELKQEVINSTASVCR